MYTQHYYSIIPKLSGLSNYPVKRKRVQPFYRLHTYLHIRPQPEYYDILQDDMHETYEKRKLLSNTCTLWQAMTAELLIDICIL